MLKSFASPPSSPNFFGLYAYVYNSHNNSFSDKQIKVDFPQEHPLSSHMSRQEMFPKFEVPISTVDPLGNEDDPAPTVETSLPQLVHVPNSTVVVQKVMGNFARREIYTPQAGAVRRPLTCGHRKVERLKVEIIISYANSSIIIYFKIYHYLSLF